jgi:SAM-dependent methyltransferase
MNEQPQISNYEEYRLLKKEFPGCGYISGNWREGIESSAMAILMQHIEARALPEQRLLDVGAADRGLQKLLSDSGFSGEYLSADTNELEHDFSDFLKINELFDIIVMFELIEHLPLETGIKFIKHAHQLLPHGGLLVISTPNADHPCQFWRSDITHVRPWPADSLWAILRQSGFNGDLTIYRQHMEGVSRNNLRKIIRSSMLFPAQRMISRLMDFDYAQNIVAFAKK